MTDFTCAHAHTRLSGIVKCQVLHASDRGDHESLVRLHQHLEEMQRYVEQAITDVRAAELEGLA